MASFDADLFFDQVYNAAYDIFEDAFDTLEENVPLVLGNPSEEVIKATTKGLDAVFNTFQEKLEKNLNRWEEYSRVNCFVNRASHMHQEAQKEQDCSEVGSDLSLQIEEDQLDAELESVRAELLAAGKESTRIRRELRNMERLLVVKKRQDSALQEAVAQLPVEDQQSMLEEVATVGALLQQKLSKMKRERMQSPRGVRWMGVARPDVEIAGLESIARTLNL